MKHLKIIFIVFVLMLLVYAVPSWAQTPTQTQTPTPGGNNLQNIISRGDAAIALRINSLNNVIIVINNLKRISQTDKANFVSQVQTEETNLNNLKAKLDADTNIQQARADYQAIFNANRVYLLFIPKMHIFTAADVIRDIISLMTQVQTNLQVKIQQLQNQGITPPSSVTQAMNDLAAKLTDAQNQQNQAVNTVTPLQPDLGNSSVLQANNVALASARTMIQTAWSDLKTARADIQTVWQWIRSQSQGITPTPTPTP